MIDIKSKVELLSFTDERAFVRRVNELLAEGWMLHGQLVVTVHGHDRLGIRFTQMMVKGGY